LWKGRGDWTFQRFKRRKKAPVPKPGGSRREVLRSRGENHMGKSNKDLEKTEYWGSVAMGKTRGTDLLQITPQKNANPFGEGRKSMILGQPDGKNQEKKKGNARRGKKGPRHFGLYFIAKKRNCEKGKCLRVTEKRKEVGVQGHEMKTKRPFAAPG